jgi:GNAT superfamily N-acetyltransferase
MQLTASEHVRQGRVMTVEVRDYGPADEQGWLRCRVLSFLATPYFDDVMPTKKSPTVGAELVAVDAGLVVGVLDLSVEGTLATIDTIGVHPDHQGQGIGTRLFEQARIRAAALGATMIDAWTRDYEPTLRWYSSRGFSESSHFLHVYANYYVRQGEPADAVQSRPGLNPIKVFLDTTIDQEAEMRKKFSRVYVCRRFARSVDQQHRRGPGAVESPVRDSRPRAGPSSVRASTASPGQVRPRAG